MTRANTILIVEDDTWQAEYFERELTRHGYRVVVAGSAPEAIHRIDVVRPDVIVLDLLLPGSNGIALLHELRSYSDTGAIPVILCSSIASALSAEQLSAYGVVKVLDKTTIKTDDLVVAVRGALL